MEITFQVARAIAVNMNVGMSCHVQATDGQVHHVRIDRMTPSRDGSEYTLRGTVLNDGLFDQTFEAQRAARRRLPADVLAGLEDVRDDHAQYLPTPQGLVPVVTRDAEWNAIREGARLHPGATSAAPPPSSLQVQMERAVRESVVTPQQVTDLLQMVQAGVMSADGVLDLLQSTRDMMAPARAAGAERVRGAREPESVRQERQRQRLASARDALRRVYGYEPTSQQVADLLAREDATHPLVAAAGAPPANPTPAPPPLATVSGRRAIKIEED